MKNKKIVIGGSGYIGSKLCDYYSENGELLAGTYVSNSRLGLEYFDLSNPNLRKLNVDLSSASHLFICSSICRIDECKRDEKMAYEINVKGTKRLIEQCFDLDIVPVFFSSDNVFNGEKGNYTEEDETNPCNVYGKHKKIIEDFLFESKKDYLIARISKMYGTDPNERTHFVDIVKRLQNNERLKQATDQILTPTHINDLVSILDFSLKNKIYGLYNLVAKQDYSRYNLAMMTKSRLRIKTGKIIKCSIKDIAFLDNRPLNPSLNSEKIRGLTGFEFSGVEENLDRLKSIV